MNKGRLEAFSDGVIAILFTIMVLELKIPRGADFAAHILIFRFSLYIQSFVYLEIYSNNHHYMPQAAECINNAIIWANLHLLFWLTPVLFGTGWMGENYFASLPTAVSGFVLLASAIAYYILQFLLVAEQGENFKLKKRSEKIES